jgi:phosphoglycerate dehydrogenase-like enzyme
LETHLPEDEFRVALTGDFLAPEGTVGLGDIGLDLLARQPGVSYEFLQRFGGGELPAGSLSDYDAVIVLGARVSAASLEAAPRLRVIARFGVGYDSVDVDACTTAGVLLTITPDGVRRPVATAALALLLALAHRLPDKDRLVRTDRWNEKIKFMGTGLIGRTLGVIGWGNIGRELTRIVEPFGFQRLATDPFVDGATAAGSGVELVSLDELLSRADFVVVTCALTPETHHLLDSTRLARMKPTAFLVNVARGPVVDQEALTRALQARAIAGAALDVLEREPPDPKDPVLGLDNVILSPHALAWTDDMALTTGSSAISSVLDVAAGRRPPYVVNRAVFEHPRAKDLAG